MLVERLKLNQYRNYASMEIRPSPGVNVITGENAQGKTNAVEAVFLCAFGRSHRTARDAELIMQGTAGGYVGMDMKNRTGAHLIEMKLRTGERKKVFVDRQLIVRSGELMGMLNVVMFSPEDLCVVRDGPSERRRFMDMEISQQNPAYYYYLQRYNSVLRQRNALLKDDSRPTRLDEINAWDDSLALLGEKLILERQRFIDAISTAARDIHSDISCAREQLELAYETGADADAPALKERLREKLSSSLNEDLRRGFTTVGPHRDDISININGADARTYASQGQKRTAALSMKLAVLMHIRDALAESPVLILDDVLSELDSLRRGALIEAMGSSQCFLTCTDFDGAKGIKDAVRFNCTAGTLVKG